MAVALVLGCGTASASTKPRAVPLRVERAIAHVLPKLAYVPTHLPSGWRYHSWDTGRETPGLFPQGTGVNIWFSILKQRSAGPGFHVFASPTCSVSGGEGRKTFRFGRIVVAWFATNVDGMTWRCVIDSSGERLMLMVNSNGTDVGSARVIQRYARGIAAMVASAHLVTR